MNVPQGQYQVTMLSPTAGTSTVAIVDHNGDQLRLALNDYEPDLAIKMVRQ